MAATTLRSFRRSQDESQKEVASVLGLSTPAYSRREAGKQAFLVPEIVKLKERWGLSDGQVWAYFFAPHSDANRKC